MATWVRRQAALLNRLRLRVDRADALQLRVEIVQHVLEELLQLNPGAVTVGRWMPTYGGSKTAGV